MAGAGGVTGQVNQSLGLGTGAIATYNANGNHDAWAGDRSRADGRYLILDTGLEEKFSSNVPISNTPDSF